MSGAQQSFADKAMNIATQEWNFWGRQTNDIHGARVQDGHQEGDDGWYQRVGVYWLQGVGIPDRTGLDDFPWSAAFISWVMREAGAGARFHYAQGHSAYISRAILDRANNVAAAGYWGYRLGAQKPKVGDLVCWGREPGVDYDHQMNGHYDGHSDLVVAVEANQVWIIGGNVGNSVTRRPLGLDANGFLKPVVMGHAAPENLFALMQNRIP